MTDTIDALIHDLLEHVAREEPPYDELIESWRTSCPKLPVWEEANERGLITQVRSNGHTIVRITAAGSVFLQQSRQTERH